MRLELVGNKVHALAQIIAQLTDADCIEALNPHHVRVRRLRQGLTAAHTQCEAAQVDFAFLPDQARLTDYRLFITDMDSTLINIECIDELADLAGKKTEVAQITEAAMQGQLDFDAALRQRVALLAGLPVSALDTVWQTRLQLNPGAAQWLAHLKTLGIKTLLVSGGFTYFTERLQTQLGFDQAYANQLEIENERLTGRLTGEIINAQAKAQKLQAACAHYQIAAQHTLAAGDGANDLHMAQLAGLTIAYHAKPVLRKTAQCNLQQHGFEILTEMLG